MLTRIALPLFAALVAVIAVGCGAQTPRGDTARTTASSASKAEATDHSKDALASAPLPRDVISLSAAKRSVGEFRFDEWQQLRRVFRFEPDALTAWEERQDDWNRMHKASDDRVSARTWLLSGLRPEQQLYWAQWAFYRIAVNRFDEDTSRETQIKCWDMAKPYAKRQMERNWVENDPYLRDIREEAASYRARVEQILDK